jgi:exonuclease SbcD
MRFLHTSDWHIGKPLRGRSRLEEQEAVAAEILDIVRRERVEVLLFSGDLFDSQAPSPEAERVVYHFFAELVARGVAAVVIGGNHDHPRRLAALRELLDPLRLYVRHQPERSGVIEITRDGERARIAALPFVPEKKIVDICRLLQPEDTWYAEYADNVGRMCELLAEGFSAETINLLAAHVFVQGAQTSGSERAIHVAQPYAVPAQRFPAAAQYIALGHLHRPQEIAAPAPCRYAGSTLQLDFGEQGQDKQVVLIEARAGRPARLEPVPLAAGRRLRDVAGTLAALAAMGDELGDDYLRVTVEGEVPSGVAERVREILPNAVHVQVRRPERPDSTPAPDTQSPDLLFAAFYRNQRGEEPPEALQKLFLELYHEVKHEADPA